MMTATVALPAPAPTITLRTRLLRHTVRLAPEAVCADCHDRLDAGLYSSPLQVAEAHARATGHTVVITSAEATTIRPEPARRGRHS